VPLGGRQAYVAGRRGDPLGGQVDGEGVGAHHRLLGGGDGPAQRGAYPGQQLVHAERLGDVVVGAGVEGVHLGLLGVPGRQHDDRGRRPAAQALDHGHAVHVGQPEIEDHQVGRGTTGRGQPRRTVGGDGHLVPSGGEGDAQGPQQLPVVVDDQDAGHVSDCPSSATGRRVTSGGAGRPQFVS
jgi:hypothetical protein